MRQPNTDPPSSYMLDEQLKATNTDAAQLAQSSVYQSSRTCRAAAPFGPLHTAPPGVPNPQPLVAGGMLTYPGDPRGNPPQHGPLSSLSTSAAPFTVAGSHPAGPTFPNPSFAVPAAPSLNAAGEWGDPSLMEAPARFMAPGAAAAGSLGYTGNAFTRYQLVRIDAEMSWHTYLLAVHASHTSVHITVRVNRRSGSIQC
jgi:hypothetical protein